MHRNILSKNVGHTAKTEKPVIENSKARRRQGPVQVTKHYRERDFFSFSVSIGINRK